MELYTCSHCNRFSAKKIDRVLRHVGSVHAHDPGFHMVCGVDGCPRTYQNYRSFRKHLITKHSHYINSTDDEPELDVEYNDEMEMGEHGSVADERTWTADQRIRSSALFLLNAKEVDKVSQCKLDQLVDDITSLVQQSLVAVETRASTIFIGDDMKRLHDVLHDPHIRNPFLSLHSEYLQKKAYKDLFGLVVRQQYI